MKRRIDLKFMAACAALLIFVSGILAWSLYRAEQAIIQQRVANQVAEALQGTQNELGVYDDLYMQRVRAGIAVLKDQGLARGLPELGSETVTAGAPVPELSLGQELQNERYGLVDRVTELQGGTATLFVKSGDAYVRVSTNVKKDDGSRAIGTILSPTGKAIQQIQRGAAYYGVVDILGKPYITAYEPMRDASGEVVGIWYVGYLMSSLTKLADTIRNMEILDGGFVALHDDRGRLLFHSENVTPERVEEVLAEGGDAGEGWVVQEETFEPWGYTTTAAYPHADVAEALNAVLWRVLLFALLGTALVVGLIYLLIRRLVARPVQRLAAAAERVAEGDLSVKLEGDSEDELGRLTDTFGQMVQGLRDSADAAQENAAAAEAAAAASEQAQAEVRQQRDDLQTSIDTMLRAMDRFADGDLTARLEESRGDAIGQLFSGYNRALENVSDMLREVRANARSANQTSMDISAATDQVAAGAQAQSETALSVAAAVEEMTQTIRANAQNATQASSVAQQSGRDAEEGARVVEQTLDKIRRMAETIATSTEAVEKLGASSREIGEIVSLIEEIADQTNLLALNAAIEAARAGEQGRGFAVVADEVRKLAERTTQATSEIGQMIRRIQEETEAAVNGMSQGEAEVEGGLRLADQAGEALHRIVGGAGETEAMVTQIAAASEEQSVTSEEMARGVEVITAASSEAARGVADIAQATGDLARLTGELQHRIGQFVLDASAPAPQGDGAAPTVPDAGALYVS